MALVPGPVRGSLDGDINLGPASLPWGRLQHLDSSVTSARPWQPEGSKKEAARRRPGFPTVSGLQRLCGTRSQLVTFVSCLPNREESPHFPLLLPLYNN